MSPLGAINILLHISKMEFLAYPKNTVSTLCSVIAYRFHTLTFTTKDMFAPQPLLFYFGFFQVLVHYG
jgi:hypothetical protein